MHEHVLPPCIPTLIVGVAVSAFEINHGGGLCDGD
jgi:hypothetical protein